jgi:hypothetical protein
MQGTILSNTACGVLWSHMLSAVHVPAAPSFASQADMRECANRAQMHSALNKCTGHDSLKCRLTVQRCNKDKQKQATSTKPLNPLIPLLSKAAWSEPAAITACSQLSSSTSQPINTTDSFRCGDRHLHMLHALTPHHPLATRSSSQTGPTVTTTILARTAHHPRARASAALKPPSKRDPRHSTKCGPLNQSPPSPGLPSRPTPDSSSMP